MRSRDDVAAMVRSDAHQGLIGRGACHFLGPAVVTVDGDDAVAVCDSILVTYRGDGFAVRRAGANHFGLRRIEGRWQIVTRTTRTLDGKAALVTGAGAGIGEGIARRFADEGARVVVAELDESTGRAVAENIGGVFVSTDVADRAQVENAVQTAFSECGSIDIVVNNAWGGGAVGRVENKTDEQLAQGIAVGYYGPYWAMRSAFPQMRARGLGPGRQPVQPQWRQRPCGHTGVQRGQGGAAHAHQDRRARMGTDGRHGQRAVPGGQEPGLLSRHWRLSQTGGDGRRGQSDGPDGRSVRRHRSRRGLPGQ
jgi:hypothetical protein